MKWKMKKEKKRKVDVDVDCWEFEVRMKLIRKDDRVLVFGDLNVCCCCYINGEEEREKREKREREEEDKWKREKEKMFKMMARRREEDVKVFTCWKKRSWERRNSATESYFLTLSVPTVGERETKEKREREQEREDEKKEDDDKCVLERACYPRVFISRRKFSFSPTKCICLPISSS